MYIPTFSSCIFGLIALSISSLFYKDYRNIKDWVVNKMKMNKNEWNGESEKSGDETEAGIEAKETEDARASQVDKQEEMPVGCKFPHNMQYKLSRQ